MTMKKLGKIKLDQLNKAELSEKELNRLLGGENCCLCACAGPSLMFFILSLFIGE